MVACMDVLVLDLRESHMGQHTAIIFDEGARHGPEAQGLVPGAPPRHQAWPQREWMLLLLGELVACQGCRHLQRMV